MRGATLRNSDSFYLLKRSKGFFGGAIFRKCKGRVGGGGGGERGGGIYPGLNGLNITGFSGRPLPI